MADGGNQNIFVKIILMQEVLQQLGIAARNSGASTGIDWAEGNGKVITSFSPVDGKTIAEVNLCTEDAFEQVISTAEKAFAEWRTWPSPKRGDIVRQIGDELRKNKEAWANSFPMKWEKVCRKVMAKCRK